MDPGRFELKLSLPRDLRFTETVRELAVHAAKYTGCSEAKAVAFGDRVETLVRGGVAAGRTDGSMPVVLRWTGGPIEVLIDGRPVPLDP